MTAVVDLLDLVVRYGRACAAQDPEAGVLLAQIDAAATGLADGPGERVVEHALRMASGSMQVRPTDPEIERVYPLVEWLANHQAWGAVYTRTVIVVDDWHEAEPAKEVQP